MAVVTSYQDQKDSVNAVMLLQIMFMVQFAGCRSFFSSNLNTKGEESLAVNLD